MERRFKYFTPIVLQKFGFVLFGVLHRVFLKIEIKGKENLKGVHGPLILACNHVSEFDVTFIPLILSFSSPLYPVYFVTNPMEKYNNFGWRSYIYGAVFFNALGGYSVHSGFKDYSIALEDHVDLLEKGRTVFIFPEGKRNNDGKISEARGGLGYLVYKTGAKVAPMVIQGINHLTLFEYLFKRRKVVITVLPILSENEIATSLEPNVDDYKKTSQMVLDKMSDILRG